MDDLDLEPDPKHRVPTILWLMLGLLLVLLFASAVIILGDHFAPHSVGAPAGTP